MSMGPLETTHGPRHAEDLEDLTRELCIKQLRGYTVERYGTSGQTQHGVDVRAYKVGSPHKLFQCKRREKLSTLQMDQELKKTEMYPFKKESYTFFTTIKRDADLQDHAVKLSNQYKIPVSIKFWDEIKEEVLLYDDLKSKFFRDYLIEIVKTNSVHIDIGVWDTRFDLVVTKLPAEKRFGDALLLVTSLQSKKSCYFRLGDFYYNFVEIIGLGRVHAFVLCKWFNQFSSFEELQSSHQTKELYLPDSEVSAFLDSIAPSECADE